MMPPVYFLFISQYWIYARLCFRKDAPYAMPARAAAATSLMRLYCSVNTLPPPPPAARRTYIIMRRDMRFIDLRQLRLIIQYGSLAHVAIEYIICLAARRLKTCAPPSMLG